ncbi:hypothetical protein LMG26411_00401 [Cupriavidus numazuensis]|uniref:Uncharacterized protein n=1 Tax=Cupriavidus numazuensis TaxID=221992 RepID=A0ABN7PS03_9BURK|nr:hypothetical protein LMG26411_00401 [Cupriavidus numazuensis]
MTNRLIIAAAMDKLQQRNYAADNESAGGQASGQFVAD